MDKLNKSRKVPTIILVLLVIMLFQCGLTVMQGLRYHYTSDADDNYCCVEMSRDVEAFFEGTLGIHVLQVRGYGYKQYNPPSELDNQLHRTPVSNVVGHRWIILDFGLFKIPYESIALLPINPEWCCNYEHIWISEGYYDGHTKVANTADLVFELDS